MTEQERKEKLATIAFHELARAEGADSDELQANRAEALEYYFGQKPAGDGVEGRSQTVSTDVADMTNATLAMLVPMISVDAVVVFEPNSEEDEVPAQAESRVINTLIMEDNRGFIEIQEAVKDSLLLKNACMKVFIEDAEDVTRYALPTVGIAKEQKAALLEPRSPDEERRIEGDELIVTTTTREFYTEAVPIENICYQADYSGPLQKIRFFAEKIEYTRSQLIEQGIDREIVDSLQPYSDTGNEASRKRNVSIADKGKDAETRDQDIIECHECYMLVDLNGDGVSERYCALVAPTNICLSYETCDLIPYALGSPFLNPHRITGESLFDHLRATQDVKTSLQRQLINNVTAINNGKFAYDPSQTAEEDVLTPRAGGGIRARNPAQSVVPIPIPDVTTGILAALNYEDMRRAERGGSSLDLLRPDRQVVSETAHGTERQMGNREALASMMATNLSETMIRDLWLLTHEFLRRYSDRPRMARIAGQYVQIDPRQWPKRTRVNVTTGMSPGARGHLQQTLAQHLQLQMLAIQNGGMGQIADLNTVYRTSLAWLRMAGLNSPESYIIDPNSPAAQQAAQMAQQQQQANQQAQLDLIKQQIQIEFEKIASNERIKKGELRHDYYDTDVRAEVEEMKLAGQGAIDLEKQRMTNASAERTAITKGPEGNRGRANGADKTRGDH